MTHAAATPPPERELLFAAGPALAARRLARAETPLLQAFIDANPEYWLRISDAPPRPDEAEDELQSRPPPELSYREHFDIGFWHEGADGSAPELQGFAIVDSDLVLAGCWHIALFIVATRLHGSGLATRCYAALEDWARTGGARWLRLGVVRGNAPAERFWERQGFVQLRLREGVAAGKRLNTVRVMLKPLVADAGIADYLARVERDRPEPSAEP